MKLNLEVAFLRKISRRTRPSNGVKSATTMALEASAMAGSTPSKMNYRRRRRILLSVPLLSVPLIQAFAPRIHHSARTSSLALDAASRTWDQTRHKLVYSGQDSPEEDASPPTRTKPIEKIKSKPMPITGYDANEICEFYDRRPFQVGWRMNAVGLPLLGWYFRLLCDRIMGVDENEAIHRKRGAELRTHLVQSGSVALIKSGQALSLRPDIIRNKIWAEELGKLVDEVGAFSDVEAMRIVRTELAEDLLPRMKAADLPPRNATARQPGQSRAQTLAQTDPILSLFEFYNGTQAVASASIGQVYKARIRGGPELEAAIGKTEAAKWGGKVVAIKVQRPDVADSAALDMYLIRRSAMWLSKFRGGDIPAVADQFGLQLFGELDYVREADNCERFRQLYGDWDNVVVPESCTALTRKRVLVQEWVDGVKGPWSGDTGIKMVRTGLKCSVDQLVSIRVVASFESDRVPHLYVSGGASPESLASCGSFSTHAFLTCSMQHRLNTALYLRCTLVCFTLIHIAVTYLLHRTKDSRSSTLV